MLPKAWIKFTFPKYMEDPLMIDVKEVSLSFVISVLKEEIEN